VRAAKGIDAMLSSVVSGAMRTLLIYIDWIWITAPPSHPSTTESLMQTQPSQHVCFCARSGHGDWIANAQQIHEIHPTPATVHYGYFDASLKPVLTIDSGDLVRLWTATGNPKYFEELGVPKEKIPAELFTAFEGVKDSARGDQTLDGRSTCAARRLVTPSK